MNIDTSKHNEEKYFGSIVIRMTSTINAKKIDRYLS